MRFPLLTPLVLFALVACQSLGTPQGAAAPVDHSSDAGNTRACNGVDDTIATLEACITRESLWRRLSAFQRIADQNPGGQGHPNRDTGTPGYAASVAYVAKLMRDAGYAVRIERYNYTKSALTGTPVFQSAEERYAFERDWFVSPQSADGDVRAPIEIPQSDGCSVHDFASFPGASIALLRRENCDASTLVENAEAAGAAAVILYDGAGDGAAFEPRLMAAAHIPVVGLAHTFAAELLQQYRNGARPPVRISLQSRRRSDVDYNVIADSPFGDANRVVVIDAHLDSIYGAGMLDNASGSTTILEVALNLAKTPTRNHLRYIWFGGEELGLLGSRYYTTHLSPAELRRIAFDVDVDVTATPNFDILIADAKNATKVKRFPKNVVPQSQIGNDYFTDYFKAAGVIARAARFGNDGTDSFAFSLAGVPNSGILTQQDCCKHGWEIALWGGFRGNYEGKVPGFDGGCVDYPHRWCDNLSNNDPFVLELASKAVASVTFQLANRRHFPQR
jgi:hypothetical protein